MKKEGRMLYLTGLLVQTICMVKGESVKLWCCVGGGNKVIWLYQQSWKCKLATVTSYKADVSSVSPSSEKSEKLRSDEGLTLETSAL